MARKTKTAEPNFSDISDNLARLIRTGKEPDPSKPKVRRHSTDLPLDVSDRLRIARIKEDSTDNELMNRAVVLWLEENGY